MAPERLAAWGAPVDVNRATVEELASLRSTYALHRHLPSMRCVGYRQAWSYLEGEIDRDALRAQGIAATRQLAKRQFTWLRALPATTFDPNARAAVEAIADKIEAAAFLPHPGMPGKPSALSPTRAR